jgi:hypothetical protein
MLAGTFPGRGVQAVMPAASRSRAYCSSLARVRSSAIVTSPSPSSRRQTSSSARSSAASAQGSPHPQDLRKGAAVNLPRDRPGVSPEGSLPEILIETTSAQPQAAASSRQRSVDLQVSPGGVDLWAGWAPTSILFDGTCSSARTCHLVSAPLLPLAQSLGSRRAGPRMNRMRPCELARRWTFRLRPRHSAAAQGTPTPCPGDCSSARLPTDGRTKAADLRAIVHHPGQSSYFDKRHLKRVHHALRREVEPRGAPKLVDNGALHQ